jgi:6-pyruvoyltetrahydropterin/6-carboxytetrahydropterin synthase
MNASDQPVNRSANIADAVHLTRRYWFSASHRLHHPALPEADNRELYGKCNNPGGHGHNYFLEVTVAGPVDLRTGMAVNLVELDALVQGRVIDPLHQSSLNELPNFQQQVPTTENLCVEIYKILAREWSNIESGRRARLERVRLEETNSNFFEYQGLKEKE